MTTFAVRAARPDDAFALVYLVNEIAVDDNTLGIDRFPLAPEDEANFLGGADPLVYLTLVAVTEPTGHLIGVLTASRGVDQKLQHVSALAIAVGRAARRQGVGLALLAGYFAWADQVGVQKCTLSVLAHNAPAIQLFERSGFVPEARRQGQFRIDGRLVDEILMARWLTREGTLHAV